MCLQCHQGLSDEYCISDLESTLHDDKKLERDFSKWNSTSLNHMYIIGTGFNGEKAQNMAFQVLEKFIAWGKVSPDYGKEFILEQVCTIESIEETLRRLKAYSEKKYEKDTIKNSVNHGQLLSELVVYTKNDKHVPEKGAQSKCVIC